ncbi:hypothetical protein MCOR20_009471 [Pyricularia oryzae]|nr:hypothetical protein MCOR20_009471 [Pyricularia oryzae]
MFFSTFLSLTILLLTFGGALPVPPPSSSPHLTSPELVLPDQEWRRSRPTAMIRKRAPYPWEFGWPFSSTSPSSSPSPKKSQPSIASSWWTPSSWGLWGQKKSAQGVPTSGGIPPNKNQQKTTHGGVPKQQATAKNTQYPPKSNTWPLTPPPRQEEIKRKPVPAKVDSLQSAKVSASLKPGPPSGNPSKEPFKSSAPWGAGWYSNLGPDPYQGQYRAYEPPTVSQHEKEKNPKKPTDAPQTATNIGSQPAPVPQSSPLKSSQSSSSPSGQLPPPPPSKGPKTPQAAEKKQTTLDSWLSKGQMNTQPAKHSPSIASSSSSAASGSPPSPVANNELPDLLKIKHPETPQAPKKPQPEQQFPLTPPPSPTIDKKLPDLLTIKRPETPKAAEKKPQPEQQFPLTPPPSPVTQKELPNSPKIESPGTPQEVKTKEKTKQFTVDPSRTFNSIVNSAGVLRGSQ